MNVLKIIIGLSLFTLQTAKADCSKAYQARSQGKFLNLGITFTENGSGSLQSIQNNLVLQSWAMNEYTAGDDYENKWEKLNKSLTLATRGQSDPYLREKILDKISKKVGNDSSKRAKELLVTWYKDGTLCPMVKDKKSGKEYQSVLSRKAIIKLAAKYIKENPVNPTDTVKP